MSVQREELLRLVEELPENEVPVVLEDSNDADHQACVELFSSLDAAGRQMLGIGRSATAYFTGLSRPGPLIHDRQELTARLLAASARFRAHPAVGVPGRMPLALVAAAPADGRARLDQRPYDAAVPGSRAAQHGCGSCADIRAVHAQANARDHLGQMQLAQVGVGIGTAGLRAVSRSLDDSG
jgi:hypothetical protein